MVLLVKQKFILSNWFNSKLNLNSSVVEGFFTEYRSYYQINIYFRNFIENLFWQFFNTTAVYWCPREPELMNHGNIKKILSEF